MYKSQADFAAEKPVGEITRENELLKVELAELKGMFDVTVAQTQEECGNYLQTIEQLKDEVCICTSSLYYLGVVPLI